MAEVFDIKNYKIVNQVSGVALAQYIETEKTVKTEVIGTGFFNPIADQLAKGSVIICSVKDGTSILTVTGNTGAVVTMSAVAATA